MNIVFFAHPAFLGSQSQPRLVRMLADESRARGHSVQVRQPSARVHRLVPQGRWSKWAGYIDQYLIFPREIRRSVAHDPADTLYVFCDQALGPWMPPVVHRPHVVHCQDLLALRSALGLIPENPTSITGRIYQRYIRAGFRRARHFVSISEKSRADLQTYGGVRPVTSDVVYLGLNHPYGRLAAEQSRAVLHAAGLHVPSNGLLLHVGGGQWYKNTAGVVHLHAALRRRRLAAGRPSPELWIVGPPPGAGLQQVIDSLGTAGEVRFLQQVANHSLEALYAQAQALLFPSLAEGFGWPIAEGLACGCPVFTTGEAPMTEVGGAHAHYLPRPAGPEGLAAWADEAAPQIEQVLDRPIEEQESAAALGMAWARRYDTAQAMERYLQIYESVLAGASPART